MSKERPDPVVIGPAGGKLWEFPDALWQKVPALQAIRLRRTVSEQVLPLLYQLDDLYPRPQESKITRIKGMVLKDIEADIPSTILALHLFDIALEQGLLSFTAKGAKKGKKPAPKAPVGSCGMSVDEARQFFLENAARKILKEAGHDPKKLHDMLGNYELKDPSSLNKLKLMARFDPLTISELKDGLRGHMGKLFERDEQYFNVLRKAKPTNFIRPLRTALGKDFSKILEWDGNFIRAVSEGLEHSAKIIALGRGLLDIEDPEIVRALGRWPMEEAIVKDKVKGKKKTYITRIEQVRRQLGDEFRILMNSNAAVIDQAGHWTDEEIEKIKFYVGYINAEVIEALSTLPFAYTISIMEGLWNAMGREFMEQQITTPQGIIALKGIAAKIEDMGTESIVPSKIVGMIENKLFDSHLSQFSK
ncbi:MAG: hypothetical protein ISR45_03240 [Rhodospirillales bacterium]|nr:hypothetical protein [Rhodospirillales bacterium]